MVSPLKCNVILSLTSFMFSCFWILSDLSPQDSTLLSDIVEIGPLPSFTRDDEGTQYAFYILTRQGLRYECSSVSKIQVRQFFCFRGVIFSFYLVPKSVWSIPWFCSLFSQLDSWLLALQTDCKLEKADATTPNGSCWMWSCTLLVAVSRRLR